MNAPSRHPRPRHVRPARLALLLAAAVLTSATGAPVEWLVDDEVLAPSTTIELRFDRDMVDREQVGTVAEPAPLVVEPALPGRFTWLSRRSGVYQPSAEPRMGTKFTLAAAPGLLDAAGKPVASTARLVVTSPPFGLLVLGGREPDEDGAPPLPVTRIAANREVDLDGAGELFRYVGDGGQRVAASVRHARSNEYFPAPPEAQPWEELWRNARHAPPADLARAAADDEGDEDGGEDGEGGPPVRSRLVVQPAAPLAPGPFWRLEIRPGLAASRGGYRTAAADTVALGRVTPFTITSVVASSYLNSGRSVTVGFSDTLAPDANEETATRFIKLTPPVENLRVQEGWREWTLRGDFQRDTEYVLEIDAALMSYSSLPLSGERTRKVRFRPVMPRVYLPEITGHQSAGGSRRFPLLAVNVKSLKVTARLVPPARAARAVEAFHKYDKDYDENNPGELYQPLPADAIEGRVTRQRTLAMPDPQLDARQEVALDWNELLGAGKPGVVFLTVEGEPLKPAGTKRPCAQALVQLTDLGVLWKKTGDRLAVSVFSLAGGGPVAGARVELLDEKFGRLAAGDCDADGGAVLPVGGEPGWLVASRGEDVHALRVGPRGSELPLAAFRVPVDYDSWEGGGDDPGAPLRALIFTDRPLYRPGETVHVKGLVRRVGPGGLEIPAGLAGELVLTKPNERGSETLEVRADERGAFDARFVLDGSGTGRCGLRVVFPGDQSDSWSPGFYTGFQVAEFQPNAFEVALAGPPRVAPGAPLAIDVSGRYFFGAPLDRARLRWTLHHSSGWFTPDGFDAFVFGGSDPEGRKPLVLRGEETLPADGRMALRPELPAAEGGPQRATLTVELTDSNQQTVSETRSFTRDAADFYLGLEIPERGVIGHAEEIAARAVAVRPDGQPLAAPVEVEAELVRVRYETVRAQGAGNAVTFHTERTEEVVERATGRTLAPEHQLDGWRLPAGETARFKPGRAGEFLLRVTARDAAGRATSAAVGVSVSGDEPIAWDYRNPSQVELVPDKPVYQVGETARIMVKTPISGEARVGVERGSRVLRSLRPRLEGNAPVIEVPVVAGDAPNVFVSLVLIRGADQSTRRFKAPEFRYGLCQLRVADPAAELNVEVAPQAPEVLPGAEVAATVRVRDGRGAPVAGAEVTFFAIDDGVLALTGYQRPRPRPIFEAPFPLAIRTGITIQQLFPEDPSDLEFANKGYLIGGGGGEGPGPRVRRDFPGTACWLPALLTGPDGAVTARFTAPDALTRYRLVAVAHAGPAKFGAGESAVTLRKPFMLLSALGQFAHAGDELVARAVLRNETGAAGTAEVSLALDATAEPAAGSPAATVQVPAGGSATVDIPVRLRAPGDAEWRWSARLTAGGTTHQDALVARLKVGHPAPLLHETYLTELSAPANDLLAGVNPQMLEGEGTVRVTLSNTRLATLREPAGALLEYPYGCAEQTTSALVPWLVVNELGPVLPGLGKTKEEIRAAIRTGVDKLFALQTPAGGIGYWPGAEPDLFASAWAAFALGFLESQQEPMPDGWPALLEYLSGRLRGIDEKHRDADLDTYALALCALAGANRSEPGYHERLLARRTELSREGRALLAIAMLEAKGSAKSVARLLDPRVPAPEGFSWFGSATRERAVQLFAWTLHEPGNREVGRLVKEVLAARSNGRWRTTQENAWALLALSSYFTAVEREVQPVNAELARAGAATPVALTKEELSWTIEHAFGPAKPLGALEVANPKKLPLYGEAGFVVRPPVAAQPRQDRGYAVSRVYQELTGEGGLAGADDLVVGDRVLVTLRVETRRPGHFVAIDDPLPAVLEAINPDFRSRQAGEGGELDTAWAADHREIRADRVLYFCDHLPAGEFTFRYLARVRAAGKVTAPAAKVEEMYRPERFGLSDSASLTSKPAAP